MEISKVLKIISFYALLPVLINSAFINLLLAESPATTLLKARSAEFEKTIIQVNDNIYTAVGYGVSPVSMIIGIFPTIRLCVITP